MQIAVLAHYYIEENRAGGELMLHEILKYLAKNNTINAYITDNHSKDKTIDGVNVFYNFDPKDIKKKKYDLIISHLNHSQVSVDDAKSKNKPVMLIVHNNMPDTKEILKGLRETDTVIFNTKWIKEDCKTPAKSIVIHPPVNIKPIKSTGDKITLINLTLEKGSYTFYRILEHLPQYNFLGVEGGYWKKRQVKRNFPNLTILPNTDKITDIYKQTKIILMPSSYESFGMVASEAAMCGIPVICSPTKGLQENLGDAGIYIERTDAKAYMAEIKRLMEDRDYYKEISDKIKKIKIDSSKELKQLDKVIDGYSIHIKG